MSLGNIQVGLNEPMNSLASRAKAARAHARLTQTQAAERSGVNQSDISKIERGETQRPVGLLALARAYGVSPDWLDTGDGNMLDVGAVPFRPSDITGGSTRYTTRPGMPSGAIAALIQSDVDDNEVLVKGIALLPLVGEVKGGDDGYLEELQYPVGHGEGLVEYPTADPSAYALRVRGDSMHPRYRAGEFVVVEPSIEPQQGDDVVVLCTNGRKLLKQLNWRRDGEVQLLSINNSYAPITLGDDEIESIQLVAGRARRSALRHA